MNSYNSVFLASARPCGRPDLAFKKNSHIKMESTVKFSTNYPYDVGDNSFTNLSSLEEELCNERTSKRNQDLVLIALRTRNAVSRRDDDTDDWGANDLDAKLEWQLIISDPDLKVGSKFVDSHYLK